MGKKILWYRRYAAQTMADEKVARLTIFQRGVLGIVWDLLYTQTDEPGRFIQDGKPWSQDRIVRAVKAVSATDQCRISYISVAYARLIDTGLVRVADDGTHYSPRILHEVERSRLAARGGRATAERYVERDAERAVERKQGKRCARVYKESIQGTRNEKSRGDDDYPYRPGTPIDELPQEEIVYPNPYRKEKP